MTILEHLGARRRALLSPLAAPLLSAPAPLSRRLKKAVGANKSRRKSHYPWTKDGGQVTISSLKSEREFRRRFSFLHSPLPRNQGTIAIRSVLFASISAGGWNV